MKYLLSVLFLFASTNILCAAYDDKETIEVSPSPRKQIKEGWNKFISTLKNNDSNNETTGTGNKKTNDKLSEESKSQPKSSSLEDTHIEDLRKIAILLGVPKRITAKMDATALISEIKIKLNERSEFKGEFFDDKEIKELEDYLADELRFIRIIKRYHSFIERIKGKNVIIIEKEH